MNINVNELSKQDEFLISNISNSVNAVNFRHFPKFTCFLDDRQRLLAKQQLNKLKYGNYMFYGGTKDCERVMLGVFPKEKSLDINNFPIISLKLSYSSRVSISHSDCLGALMGLQIDRTCVGDINVLENCAFVFVTENIADFVILNLNKVGKASVQVSINKDEVIEKQQAYELISGTVSSLRIDCVISFLISKSRSMASQLIMSKLVKVNHCDVNSISCMVKSNDVIVIRGKGKFIIDNDIKTTKKDKYYITIKKLI